MGYRCARGKRKGVKATAWTWFSKYIRLRDCIATTGSTGYCKCFTCGKVVPYEQIDAGHALGHRQNAVLFDESIVFGQCRTCNSGHDGEKQAARRYLIERHGEEWVEMKESGMKQSVDLSQEALQIISDHYRRAYNCMKKDT